MNPEIIQMLEGAKKAITQCARATPGENVLIVTDTEMDLSISIALACAATYEGAEPVIAVMNPRKGHAEEPPDTVREAMLASDIIFTPTSKTLFHTKATRDACAQGARLLSMTGALPRTLMRGAITADFQKIEPTVIKLAEMFTTAETITVTTPGGTNISASIKGRIGQSEPGIARKKGDLQGVPNIEANVTPVEDTTEGVFVVDVTATDFGFVDMPIRIDVKKGKAVNIKGGVIAQRLKNLLESAHNPAQYVVAEFGFGLNPNAELQGRIIEDESALGTCHIALGDNLTLGGQNKAPMHIDLIMKDPLLELDGKKVIDRDNILI
ncbi:MAG: aminopeptidase [Candidatus Methanofastidiosia archaeon]|jgi:leucyl aminopeptidase (aminopeptidase T)